MHTIMWRSTLALRMIYQIIAKFYSLSMTIVLYIIEYLYDNYYYVLYYLIFKNNLCYIIMLYYSTAYSYAALSLNFRLI